MLEGGEREEAIWQWKEREAGEMSHCFVLKQGEKRMRGGLLSMYCFVEEKTGRGRWVCRSIVMEEGAHTPTLRFEDDCG